MATTSEQDVGRIIRSMDEEFMRNVKARDVEKMVSAFYAEDAQLLPPNSPPVKGRAAIREMFRNLLQGGLSEIVVETSETRTSGDLAYAVGAYRLTIQPPGAEPVNDTGKYVVVYRRQGSDWRAVVDMFSSNQPAK